ncbi:hypothetical protein INT45_001716, partial [Circinella minor]
RERLFESKWSKWFLALALMQVIVTVPILIVTLIKVETSTHINDIASPEHIFGSSDASSFKNYLRDKVIRVRMENIWFILYEIWKLWLVFDAILQANSLTVIASAAFTCFSGALGIMQIVESINCLNSLTSECPDSLPLNLYLQIAMTSVVWLIAIPTAFVAFMLYKDYGWNLVERTGPDKRLQDMYYTVQCFTLMIKIDIFFEVLLLVFYAVCANQVKALWIAATVLTLICLITLLLGREAIAKEKHWMMSLFSLFQGGIIFINLGVMAMVTDTKDVWYTLSIYGCASVVIVVFTLVMAVRCQRNFGRGLQPHVNWSLYRKASKTSTNLEGGNSHQQERHHRRSNRRRQREHHHTVTIPAPLPPPHASNNSHISIYETLPESNNMTENKNDSSDNKNNDNKIEDEPSLTSTSSATRVPPSVFTEYYRLQYQAKR